MNFQEIKNIILELAKKYNINGDLFVDKWGNALFWEQLHEKCGLFEKVTHEWRDPEYNDEHARTQTVYHFKDHNVYVALDGHHESWSDGYINQIEEIYQVELKTITREYYARIKE